MVSVSSSVFRQTALSRLIAVALSGSLLLIHSSIGNASEYPQLVRPPSSIRQPELTSTHVVLDDFWPRAKRRSIADRRGSILRFSNRSMREQRFPKAFRGMIPECQLPPLPLEDCRLDTVGKSARHAASQVRQERIGVARRPERVSELVRPSIAPAKLRELYEVVLKQTRQAVKDDNSTSGCDQFDCDAGPDDVENHISEAALQAGQLRAKSLQRGQRLYFRHRSTLGR